LRWKLLILTALVAALAGAGACLAALRFLPGANAARLGATDALDARAWAALILPLASVTYAAIFVYRRTARRRTLQALLTAVVALAVILGAIFAASMWAAREAPVGPRPAPEVSHAV
jgi:hypothetical protein